MDLGRVGAESLRGAGHLKWTGGGPDFLGAGVAEMDFPPAPAVAAAVTRAVEHGVLGYPPPGLERELAGACAAWQREAHGWAVAPEDVRVLPDAIRALRIAVEHFSRPGSPVIVPVPAYMPFLEVPRLLGREIIPVGMSRAGGRHRLDPEALRSAFAAGGHLLVLCSPHNPLGHVPHREELLGIARVVEECGGRVLADEIHASLVHEGGTHIPYASVCAAAAAHTFTVTSASKAWNLAGLKCAQVILHNDADRERWSRLDRLAVEGVGILGLVAGTAAYRDGRGWLDEVLALLDRNRRTLDRLVHELLPGARYTPPEGTYLAWLDLRAFAVPPDGPAALLAERARVGVVDGAECGEPGRGFVRLNFATTEPILTRIVQRIADALADHRPGTRPR